MLDFDVDNYNGVIVKESSFPTTTEDFVRVLQTSVEAWKDERRRGVWLKVPVGRAELITVALAEGFELHHAEKAYVMLNRWLPSSENSLPPNASHQVGIGALVLNDSKEVLVVRERRGPLRGTGLWKVPTGLLNAGEDIPDAAVREVKEETGLDTEFSSIIAFRHGHSFLFGKSDLFFVTRMILKPGVDSTALSPQASEIEACQWMPLSEYAEQQRFKSNPLFEELHRVMQAHANADARPLKVGLDAGTGTELRATETDQDEDGRKRDSNGAPEGHHPPGKFSGIMLDSGRLGCSMLYHGAGRL